MPYENLLNNHFRFAKKGVKLQNQNQIYQELKYLRSERQIHKAERAIQEFIEKWTLFIKYFTTNYIDRKEQWAVCYRDVSIPDTTAHAEAFHNILKRVYSAKRNRYMKTLVEQLMRIEEEYLIKFHGYDLTEKVF